MRIKLEGLNLRKSCGKEPVRSATGGEWEQAFCFTADGAPFDWLWLTNSCSNPVRRDFGRLGGWTGPRRSIERFKHTTRTHEWLDKLTDPGVPGLEKRGIKIFLPWKKSLANFEADVMMSKVKEQSFQIKMLSTRRRHSSWLSWSAKICYEYGGGLWRVKPTDDDVKHNGLMNQGGKDRNTWVE